MFVTIICAIVVAASLAMIGRDRYWYGYYKTMNKINEEKKNG